MFKLTKELYDKWLLQLIKADKELDRNWFCQVENYQRCKILINYWTNRYSLTHETKYREGFKKLRHLLKVCRDNAKWKQHVKDVKLKEDLLTFTFK